MTRRNFTEEQVYPDEFAAALVQLRDSLGVSNWPDFGNELRRRTGIRIKVGTWQHLAPNYRRQGWPNGEVVFILGAAGIFRFPNGEMVTSDAMLEIYAGQRDRNGNAIEAVNGAGAR